MASDLLQLCVEAAEDVVGSRTPGAGECAEVCSELAAASLELALVVELGCVGACVAATQEASTGGSSVPELLCGKLFGGQNTSDWCDLGSGAGPQGSVSFFGKDPEKDAGAAPVATLVCDGALHSIPLGGRDVWWRCSGSGTTGHTVAAQDQQGHFGVQLKQETKTGWLPGQSATSCRLLWTFP